MYSVQYSSDWTAVYVFRGCRMCVYCSTSANMAAVDGRRYWESAVQISLIPIVYSDLLGLFLRVIR